MITMTNMCMEKPAACLYVEYINIYICIHREKGDRGGRMKLSSQVERDHMALVIQWSLTENLRYMVIVLAAWETSNNLIIMIHA